MEARLGALDHLRLPEVVQVDDPFQCAGGVYHDDRRDAALLHDPECFNAKNLAVHRQRRRGHYVLRASIEQVRTGRHMAAEVAVSDDSLEFSVAINDARHSETLPRHLVDHIRHRRI